MYGMQGDSRYARQHREDIRREVSRNRADRRDVSGVFGNFGRELVLDAQRFVAFAVPYRRKKGTT